MSLVVVIAKEIERFFGQRSDGNLCVTKAMKEWLKDEWNIEASVLYDRAPKMFHTASLNEKYELFEKLRPILGLDCQLMEKKDGMIRECEDRPAVLVSSTSWTADEDFHILLHALSQCDIKYSYSEMMILDSRNLMDFEFFVS